MTDNFVLKKTYNLSPPFNEKEILRYAGCQKADNNIKELMHSCIDEIKNILTYKVCYREFPVSVNENTVDLCFEVVNSNSLSKNLSDCKSVVLFAATVGLALDRVIAKYSRISPAKALMLQAIGSERIETLCDLFCDDISKAKQKEGYLLKPRFSPGYGDLPLSLQKQVFACLNCYKHIGISLDDSLLMSPSKSVTAIVGITDKFEKQNKKTCANCNLNSCSFRRNK